MAVYLDLRATQTRRSAERGIPRYVRELAFALEEVRPGAVDRYVLSGALPVPGALEPLVAGGRVAFVEELNLRPGDVYHLGSPMEEAELDDVWPRSVRGSGASLVVTLYDLIPQIFSQVYLQNPITELIYRARLELVRQADRVAAISEATAKDAVDLLGLRASRVRVVGAGVGQRFLPPTSREAALAAVRAGRPEVEPGFILYTGGIDHRKNVEGLLAGYAGLPESAREAHQLVIVCAITDEQRAMLGALLDELGILGRVLFTGVVSDDELVALYQSTTLFVFPSLYEGFGLPVVEAMACGAPVIAGRTSSLIELVRDEEALFDPTSTEDIADALERGLTDAALRARLVASHIDREYTWHAVAERTADVYAELPGRRPHRPSRRLAVVTPLPPQPTGVADYSHRLLARLAQHRPIDAFVEDDALPVEAPDGVRVLALSDIDVADRAAGGYRDVLYCLGNSSFHAAMLPVLEAFPGPVLAHDVRFTGLYGWIQEHRPEYGLPTLPELIEQQYGARVPEGLGAGGFVHPVEADRYGVLLARDLIARSTAFLVHSRYAAELALLDADPADRRKVAHVPYGAPDRAGFEPREPQPGLIATFGHVSEMKQLSKLVEAFALLAADHPDLRLAIVGPATEHERERLWGQLSKLGLPARVTLTGQVPRQEYLRWLSRAAVAVQLRAAPNGETSGAVADCLTAGVPVVVTGVGAARELPRGSVVPVERDVSAHGLADQVAGLLASVERRLALSAAGRAWAADATIDRAAAAIAASLAAQRP